MANNVASMPAGARGPVRILSGNDLAQLAHNAGIPDDQIATSVAIALAESSGRTRAIHHNRNGTVDLGPWQINRPSVDESLFDPKTNAEAMARLYKERGWQPWVVYNRGTYLRYLPRGKAAAANVDKGGGGESFWHRIGAAFTTENPVVGPFLGGHDPVSEAIADPTKAVFSALLNPRTWLRVAMVVGGGAMILLGLLFLARGEIIGTVRKSIGGK